MCGKKRFMLCKQTPCEVNIGLVSTVVLRLLKSNMKLKLVTSVYVMFTYLPYLCKPEHAMSELMKKA